MIFAILLGITTVSATVLVHAAGTTWWLRHLRNLPHRGHGQHKTALRVLVETALFLIALHVVEVLIWATAYAVVKPAGLASLEDAVYFSFTTFTTLGYGDVVIRDHWKLLTGIESLNGVLLIGWSTALLFAVIEGVWEGIGDSPADLD
ncbi:MAG: potassium channel family protein [Acidobacteriota bacterium]